MLETGDVWLRRFCSCFCFCCTIFEAPGKQRTIRYLLITNCIVSVLTHRQHILFSLLAGIGFFSIVFHSCRDLGDNNAYVGAEGLTVRATATSLLITNRSAETVYYFAVEEVTYTVIDWIQTCNFETSVPVGSTKEVSYTQILGYKHGCKIVLVWWQCSGTMVGRPGGVRTLVIQTL